MYFVKHGSGKNVFIGLHGWSGDHRTFSPLAPYIPEDVTLYSMDLPGNGRSSAPKVWSVNQLVVEITDAITSLQVSPVTILGSCSGGLLGLFLVRRFIETGRRDLITRLILIEPFAYFPWYFRVFIAPQMGKVGWYAYYTTFANPIGRWLTNISLRKHRTKKSDLTESFAETNHRTAYLYLQMLARCGTANQFHIVGIPVSIIYGENTFGAVHDSVRIWQQVLPQADCYELKGTGHLPLEEAPNDLANVLFQTNYPEA